MNSSFKDTKEEIKEEYKVEVIVDGEKTKRLIRPTAKAKKKEQQRSIRKKHWLPCPKCNRLFNPNVAERGGHLGYCRKSHLPQELRSDKSHAIAARSLQLRHQEQKKQVRQLRRKQRLYKKNTASEDFYLSQEWRELRFKILRKYGSVCMACFRPGRPGFPMHVDHIKPRSKYPELQLDPDNLQVLCADCNLGKCNYSEDDLRPK